MKVSDFITNELIRLGVTYVFTLPGGFSMHLNDSIHYSALKSVYMLHESGAAFAAAGYAQYTGRLGVCVITSGPACTNVLTAVASAWCDSLPLLIISGDVKWEQLDARQNYRLRQGGPQDVPIIEMVRPITKYAATPGDPRLTKVFLREAVRMALEPRRGPVWLNVPLDVQTMQMPND